MSIVAKVLISTLTALAVVWMIEGLSKLGVYVRDEVYCQASPGEVFSIPTWCSTSFWHYQLYLRKTWTAIQMAPLLGPAKAYYSFVRFSDFLYGPLLAILGALLAVVYAIIIFRNKSLPHYQKWLWFASVAVSNSLLLPVVMPFYLLKWIN